MIKYLIAIFLILVSYGTPHATTTSCDGSLSDCQSKVTAATAGDTITIPSGNFTWNNSLNLNKGLTIQGAGSGSTTVTSSGGSNIIAYSAATNNHFRITGMTLSGGGRSVVIVAVQNTSTSTTLSNFRIDNCVITGGLSSTVFNIEGMVYGLIDNNTITGYGVLYYAGQDNYSWNTAFQAGTANMLYLEDNTITLTSGGYVSQTCCGARWALRHNTATITGASGGLDAHGNQSYNTSNIPTSCALANNSRGVLGIEVYSNAFTGASGGLNIMDHRGGAMYFYNNTSNNTYGYSHIREEDDNATVGDCYPLVSKHPGWDPVANAYWWNNTTSNSKWNWTNEDVASGMIVEKTDYWADTQSGSTSATTYWASGEATSKPATCTTQDVYWATDTSKLYRCTSTNTWTEVYTPYTYPHPLRGEEVTTYTVTGASMGGGKF